MDFRDMVGKRLVKIDGATPSSECVTFRFDDGTAWQSMHMRDCCESVSVHRVDGNIEELLGKHVTFADETSESNVDPPGEYNDSWTWTRQRITAGDARVVIVWLGESNGYYGETPYLSLAHGELI